MKKIVNCILIVGTFISICVVLKLSGIPAPSFFSLKLTEFWTTSAEQQQDFVLFYDLALGFIMSTLFYFIIDDLPDKIRLHKAKVLIRKQINQLVHDMEQIISIIIAKYEIDFTIKEVTQKDFLVLDGEFEVPKKEISYLTTNYTMRGEKKTAIREYGALNDVVKNNLKHIKTTIVDIKKFEYFYSSDISLVECIRQIEECDLSRLYLKPGGEDNKNPCFIICGTSKAMEQFVNLYLKLLKHRYHTEYSSTTLDSIEETQKYRFKRENGIFIQNALDAQAKISKMALENPTAIVSGSKYTTKIVVNQIKKSIIAEYINIHDTDIEKLSKFKYVVFVVDSETRQVIEKILKEEKFTSGILLLTEKVCLDLGRRERKFNRCGIIKELHFLVPLKIKGISFGLNKNEPSEKSITQIVKEIKKIICDREVKG